MAQRANRPRKEKQFVPAPTTVKPRWTIVAITCGVLLFSVALFGMESTVRTLSFWLSREDYVRTELKVTDLSIDEYKNSILWGVVAETGEEIHCPGIPKELRVFDSPDDATGRLMLPGEARGKVIPIWFAPKHDSFFQSAKVYYVSDYASLPSNKLALGGLTANVAVLMVGALLIFTGVRHRREKKSTSPPELERL